MHLNCMESPVIKSDDVNSILIKMNLISSNSLLTAIIVPKHMP